MYIQDESFNRRTWTEVELADKISSGFIVKITVHPIKKILCISKTKISIDARERRWNWQKMGRQRPREFQNLKPSAARLYFIFLSHFIMPLLRKKIWCDAGRVYGSTVFHATRRIPESERIWKDHFSSNRQTRGEQIYIKVRIFLKDHALTLRFRY